MILAIDIGNTNIVVGGMEGRRLVFTLRIRSDRNKTVDEYLLEFKGLLELKGVSPSQVEGGILSSVVPELKIVIGRAMEVLTGRRFLVVGTGIRTGLNIKMDNPSQLGADLVVDAVAALAQYRPPLVIFDMGTATTMSVLDRDGGYIGGQIIPGMRLSMDALSARAAQLPYINLEGRVELIGTNTITCMQAGAVYSTAAMLDGLIQRVEEKLEQPVTAVATGGLMPLVLPYGRQKLHYHENLMLEGLELLYEKNRGGRK